MKVEIEYKDGTKEEVEAQNSFHAHSIILYSFLMPKGETPEEAEKGIVARRADCKEIGAYAELRDGAVKMHTTDAEWEKWSLEEAHKGEEVNE